MQLTSFYRLEVVVAASLKQAIEKQMKDMNLSDSKQETGIWIYHAIVAFMSVTLTYSIN